MGIQSFYKLKYTELLGLRFTLPSSFFWNYVWSLLIPLTLFPLSAFVFTLPLLMVDSVYNMLSTLCYSKTPPPLLIWHWASVAAITLPVRSGLFAG